MHASEDDIHASTGESAEPKRHDESIEKLHGKHQKSEVVSDQISDGAVGAGSTGVNDTTPTTKAKDDVEVLQQVPSGPPHSVFSSREKHYITFLAAWASFFSPLSANIYFPALTTLARELHKSNTLINLTLTSYMIFQGIAPTVFGDLADMIGRRPVYILGFVIYIGANIGLALQNNYAALFVLRCLQSTGSSGTVALGNGVIADIATSGERGKYISYVSLGPMAAPALAPVLGGVLSQFLGWRAIFWFLTIMAVVYLFVLIVSFPETGRNVVGNGSVPPQGWNVSLLNYLKTRKLEHNEELSRTPTQEDLARQRRLRWPNPVKVLHIITEKDVGLLLLYNALVYTAFYAVTASIPYLFAQIYGFNDLQIGSPAFPLLLLSCSFPSSKPILSFIPFGIGCAISSLLTGPLMDHNYRRIARAINFPIDIKRGDSLQNFPIERARIQVIWPTLYIGIATVLGYGWAMEYSAPLAVPLVLFFIIGLCLTGAFNVMSAMCVDLYPMQPSTATAANNLMRCLMGAAGTAVIIEMIEGMGRGWCFTFVAAVMACTSPLLAVIVRWGPGWREERRVRVLREKEASGIRGGG
ncbi:MAG: hypothetical protein LQ338_001837 [Usnochroma carphineum]|nr:MAG: hypothetical protein LQ338_001837 [Usnochroma carphineum]